MSGDGRRVSNGMEEKLEKNRKRVGVTLQIMGAIVVSIDLFGLVLLFLLSRPTSFSLFVESNARLLYEIVAAVLVIYSGYLYERAKVRHLYFVFLSVCLLAASFIV